VPGVVIAVGFRFIFRGNQGHPKRVWEAYGDGVEWFVRKSVNTRSYRSTLHLGAWHAHGPSAAGGR
jgi:hypothetical protein